MNYYSRGLNVALRDIVFVAGNGLSLDLRKVSPSIPNPSKPLSVETIPEHHFWSGPPDLDKLDFRVYYPHLMEVIENFRCGNESLSDFEVIQRILTADGSDPRFITNHVKNQSEQMIRQGGRGFNFWNEESKKAVAVTQLRLYVTYVFSYFDRLILREHLEGWRWIKWLNFYRNRISQIISFNYDISIERGIQAISQTDYVLTQRDIKTRLNPLLIAKPHGSINHTIPDVIATGQVFWNYPARNTVISLIQGDVSILARQRLYDSREFSDIVLPTEAPGERRRLRHIDYGYERLRRVGRNAQFCVIAGLSYSEVDRPEINEIIDMAMKAKLIVCDPNPSPALCQHLDNIGLNYILTYENLPDL